VVHQGALAGKKREERWGGKKRLCRDHVDPEKADLGVERRPVLPKKKRARPGGKNQIAKADKTGHKGCRTGGEDGGKRTERFCRLDG